jgi:predicted DNA-binding protein with PD1-like motif
MKSKLLDDGERRTYAVVFESGDEVSSGLLRFAKERGLRASHLTAIGAFDDVTLGFFDFAIKDYRRTRLCEQVEVVSLVGDIALDGDEPRVHAHVVVAKEDGSAYGGHLLEARVRPTLEVVVVESPAYLRRVFDRDTGLTLIDPSA